MPYLNMDDNFADHPKVDGLSDGAFRLHVSAMCYAAKHLTDGYIPPERVPRLTPKFKPAQLDELIKAGLWVQHDTGHRIHDYLDWNKSRAWWEAKRASTAARVAKWRSGKGKTPLPDEPPPDDEPPPPDEEV
jgi:hypothetical protein